MTPAPAIDAQALEKHTPMMQRDLMAELQGLAHCEPHFLRQNLR